MVIGVIDVIVDAIPAVVYLIATRDKLTPINGPKMDPNRVYFIASLSF